jgi:hypothetical protein
VSYVTKQAILEESGLYQRVSGESLAGVNGSNKVFTTAMKPLVDTNYDDQVDFNDIIVYVNGVSVPVAILDPDTGTAALVTAPANGTTVTGDYRTSGIPDGLLDQVRDEAQDLIDSAMNSTDPTPYDDTDLYPAGVPATVRKMARVYAAGLLLVRDYGFNRDTQGTSKDGAMKLQLVEGQGQPGTPGYKPGWLDKYQGIGGATGVTAADDTAEVISEPNIFTTFDQTTKQYSADDEFMRDLGAEL